MRNTPIDVSKEDGLVDLNRIINLSDDSNENIRPPSFLKGSNTRNSDPSLDRDLSLDQDDTSRIGLDSDGDRVPRNADDERRTRRDSFQLLGSVGIARRKSIQLISHSVDAITKKGRKKGDATSLDQNENENSRISLMFNDLLIRYEFSASSREELNNLSITKKIELLEKESLGQLQKRTIIQDLAPYKYSSKPSQKYSPKWYVEALMSQRMTVKRLGTLENQLRNETNLWIQDFLMLQGHVAISVQLTAILKKSLKTNDELQQESLLLYCLKNIANRKEGSDLAVESNQLISCLLQCLLSTRISVKNVSTDILALLSLWKPPKGRAVIMANMASLVSQTKQTENSISLFRPWLASVLESLEDYHFLKQSDTPSQLIDLLNNYFLVTVFSCTIVSGRKHRY